MAIITDDFGGTAGIITMEDLLEEMWEMNMMKKRRRSER